MIRRLYVNNFRCFLNFDFQLNDNHTALLVGNNGAGKSTVMEILRILQRIALGENHLEKLIVLKDFGFQKEKTPIRIQIEVMIHKNIYIYELVIEYPSNFLIPRVQKESLSVDGKIRYSRDLATIKVSKKNNNTSGQFALDWHFIGLPVIQTTTMDDPIATFRDWLKMMMLLSPVPQLMQNESSGNNESIISMDCSNMTHWISNILATYPKSYSTMEKKLSSFFPDFHDIIFNLTGKNSKELEIRFKTEEKDYATSLEYLSDGEKCLLLGAVVNAAAHEYENPFCFWDEPSNYLAPSETNNFIRSLRNEFEQKNGQFIAISHSETTIEGFSDENTWLFERKGHMEPTVNPRTISQLRESKSLQGDLLLALSTGDIYGS